ncbi:MAG: 1-deoxy-D-xylulose-5-phosphate reductoisomerase [Phycisphaerales bacterium]|nr:1-deoxy-D-xylulose-5-phosphate reductoisomerase [Phycisphaerales bacterium]MCB9857636.1 1-deoxy-D-xylulose-5-phosphate reductoisomerase [Phycisphaerales bacterium]MCB9864807.1 1-deoxy-D-xylulose-5-phosphate reductoisomerase [Phycisphaerales bacterium]
MPKRMIILGSTGSIGESALDVAAHLGGDYRVVGLAACRSWERMAEQVEAFRPAAVAMSDEAAAARLAARLSESGTTTDILSGPDAMRRLVEELDADFVLSAIVGVAGLDSTLAAVKRGLTVGLANKESLVVAGQLMVDAAAASGAKLIPVDSEHSAIYQSLHSGRHEEIERILLTASGGPFRTWTYEAMRKATLEGALKHPTWDMGPKITIDSATMMNKALEIIEARWLFDISADRIEVVIHPESIIHSMVAFHDGSIVAQMGTPDMRTPIQYAMTYPHRIARAGDRLDFSKLERMHFEPPDVERFPALRLGHEVARTGGTAGAAFNAANEAAVAMFRAGKIGFLDISSQVEDVLRRHEFAETPDLATLMKIDAWSRNEVNTCCRV